MTSYLVFVRAIAVRLTFTVHGLISIWKLTVFTSDNRYWYLCLVLCLLLAEMTITLGKKAGQEWKWFCPSVFIYLLCIVPTFWFLELNELERRLNEKNTSFMTTEATLLDILFNNTGVNSSVIPPCNCDYNIGRAEAVVVHKHHEETVTTPQNAPQNTRATDKTTKSILGVKLPLPLDSDMDMNQDEWIRMLEQILLLILILGRWILPKGKLTHDQLSQLLLVYIGTAADIVEFFEAFKEDKVRYDRMLCIVILGIWSLSLIQFSLVLTASRVRRDRTGLVPITQAKGSDSCCNPDVYGILISICLQDLPFLVLRLLLIFKYDVLSYTNTFFTCKNTIVIVLLIYRLIVVHMERKRLAEEEEKETQSAIAKLGMLAQHRGFFASAPAVFDNSTSPKRGVGVTMGYGEGLEVNGGNIIKITGYGSGQKFLGGVPAGTDGLGSREFVVTGGDGKLGSVTIGSGSGLIGANREDGSYRGLGTLSRSASNYSYEGPRIHHLSPYPKKSLQREVKEDHPNRIERGGEVEDLGELHSIKLKEGVGDIMGEKNLKLGDYNLYDVRATATTRTFNNNSYNTLDTNDLNSVV